MNQIKAKALGTIFAQTVTSVPFIEPVSRKHAIWSHKWLINKRHGPAIRVTDPEGASAPLVLVIVEWLPHSQPGEWFLVVVSEKAIGTTEVELHHTTASDKALKWTYAPKKHDGQNAKRKKVFASKYAGCQAFISLPTSTEGVVVLVEEILELVNDRRQADALNSLSGKAPPNPETEANDAGFPEGHELQRYIIHRHRERKLRAAKINEALERDGCLKCEVPNCAFDFKKTYGALGEGFAHVHHRIPLGTLNEVRLTKLEDLAIVCANCHAMIHTGGESREISAITIQPTVIPGTASSNSRATARRKI